jgi:HEAT repeat protein
MRRLWILLGLFLIAGAAAAANPFAGKSDDEIAALIDQTVQKGKAPDSFGNALAGVLSDPNAGIRARERAAWAIGELNYKPGIPALEKGAQHKGLLIRSASINSLARMRPASALPTLANAAANDPILQIRQHATIALGLLRSDKAIDPLVKLSQDPLPEIRGASALAMAMLQSKKNDFREVLKEMEGDDNPYVKERAERGMEIAGGKTAAVMSALKTGDADVRLAAAAHLEHVAGSKEIFDLEDAWNGEADEDVRTQLQRTIVATKERMREEKARRDAEKKAQAAAGVKTSSGTAKKTTGTHHTPAKKKTASPAAAK